MSEFEKALHAEMNATKASGKFEAFSVGKGFVSMIKKAIEQVGLGGLTKEQFLAIVGTAFDAMTTAMNIPPMIKSSLKMVVLSIAGAIYDKRHPSTPPAPAA